MNAPLPPIPGSQTLARLAPGSRAQVVEVGGPLALRRRLLEMGLCPGIEVEVLRRAPLGDPIELRLRGYLLSLRLDQAAQVTVITVVAAAA
jgi:Fe2+ transport system protein FeoA